MKIKIVVSKTTLPNYHNNLLPLKSEIQITVLRSHPQKIENPRAESRFPRYTRNEEFRKIDEEGSDSVVGKGDAEGRKREVANKTEGSLAWIRLASFARVTRTE